QQQQPAGWGAPATQPPQGGWNNQGSGQQPWDQQQVATPPPQDPWSQQQQQPIPAWGGQNNQQQAPNAFGASGSNQGWGAGSAGQVGQADPWGQQAQQPQQAQPGSWPGMAGAGQQQPVSPPPGSNQAQQPPSWQQGGFNQGQMGQPAQQGYGGFDTPDGDRTMLGPVGARGPAAQGRTGIVRIEEGKEPGRIYEMRKETLSIGRSRESDIFLEDLAVSRLHASIISMGNSNYALRDEGSANGTKVNGQTVNKYQPYTLQEGDKIQLGQTVLVFARR
ncbi:MAG TPA: FHA domain-containing protein, partial [Ktedonobacteraceae bacterium]|nr:FHA domain-containing protein [Ktedonobacteraceae bacterium]